MLHAVRSTVYALPLQEVIKPLYSLVHVFCTSYILFTVTTKIAMKGRFVCATASPASQGGTSNGVSNHGTPVAAAAAGGSESQCNGDSRSLISTLKRYIDSGVFVQLICLSFCAVISHFLSLLNSPHQSVSAHYFVLVVLTIVLFVMSKFGACR